MNAAAAIAKLRELLRQNFLRRAFVHQRPTALRPLPGESGSSLVEFTVSSVALITIVIGLLQACLAVYDDSLISNIARDAARWAIVRGSTSCTNTPNLTNCNATSDQIKSYIKGLNYTGIDGKNLGITVTWLTASSSPPVSWTTCTTGTCNAPGNAVEVTVTYSYPLNIPFLPANTAHLSSASQMVISQ